ATEAAYMGCRTRVMSNVHGKNEVNGRGNLSFTTINLPRMAMLWGMKRNGQAFFDALDAQIEATIQQLLLRLDFQKKRTARNFPFLHGQEIWNRDKNVHKDAPLGDILNSGTLAIGFIGLADCLIALVGKHHGECTEARALGLKIVTHMRKRCDEAVEKYQLNFSLIATPAEGLSGRFTKLDRKLFGVVKDITDKEYYTNSFHVPVSYETSIANKIDIEAPYHALTNGGHITYVELDGNPSKNLEAFEQIIRYMQRSGIGYGSINHPLDRDPVCGWTGYIEGSVCPKCGRDETISRTKFERIRRITGYLVGTVDRFNDAKKAELNDRIRHN
ncbi:MAG: anaerobic ribonucleoside-triphosphate reductase, partial [Bacilli bacterium]